MNTQTHSQTDRDIIFTTILYTFLYEQLIQLS